MGLIVQKFGGSSVGNIELIQRVAAKVKKTREAGNRVVVVVSAMQGETDRLVKLAEQVCDSPLARELDVLLASGEQVSVALLTMALVKEGVPAISLLGHQVPIFTDGVHNQARIQAIPGQRLVEALDAGQVVVVAGFQGVDPVGNLTTLGRGGSDTTAVALAAALKADECQIYTDVDGVYTADPRVVAQARRIPAINFEAMLELSSMGAKVLQTRSVEFAAQYRVPLRVLSTFVEGPGTLMTHGIERSKPVISTAVGLSICRDQTLLGLRGIPDAPGMAAEVLGPFGREHIEVDTLVQSNSVSGKADFLFTVARQQGKRAKAMLNVVAKQWQAEALVHQEGMAKLSLIGVGLRSHAGVASQMFRVLGLKGINIQLIATSEMKISVILEENVVEMGVNALHEAFQLDRDLGYA